MDFCTVYFSQSVEPFDLDTTLQQSRTYNTELGITGVMLYVRGSIIQVLEGEEVLVDALFQRIKVDSRHCNVEHILTRPITRRLFAEWSMGYESINDSQLKEIQAILSLDTQGQHLIDEPLVLRVIRTFYETNRHNRIMH
nr:hypothetical protein A6C57_00340 [Fibrella sp. ES10-3-2-2]